MFFCTAVWYSALFHAFYHAPPDESPVSAVSTRRTGSRRDQPWSFARCVCHFLFFFGGLAFLLLLLAFFPRTARVTCSSSLSPPSSSSSSSSS